MWSDFDNDTIEDWKIPQRPNSIVSQVRKPKSSEVK